MSVSRVPRSCQSRPGSARVSRSFVHLPTPLPVLDPFDVMEVLTRSNWAHPGRGSNHQRTVNVVLCSAAYEVISVVLIHDVPADGAESISDLLVSAVTANEGSANEGSATDVSRVMVVLGRGSSVAYPDLDELCSWRVLDERMAAIAVEVSDLLTVTPGIWSSMSLDHGPGWYDGTTLSALLDAHRLEEG